MGGAPLKYSTTAASASRLCVSAKGRHNTFDYPSEKKEKCKNENAKRKKNTKPHLSCVPVERGKEKMEERNKEKYRSDDCRF